MLTSLCHDKILNFGLKCLRSDGEGKRWLDANWKDLSNVKDIFSNQWKLITFWENWYQSLLNYLIQFICIIWYDSCRFWFGFELIQKAFSALSKCKKIHHSIMCVVRGENHNKLLSILYWLLQEAKLLENSNAHTR